MYSDFKQNMGVIGKGKGKAMMIFVFLALAFVICNIRSVSFAGGINFSNFSDTSNLKLNGSAVATATSDGTVIRLTPAKGYHAGTSFSSTTINILKFSTFFKFRITESGGEINSLNTEAGADGIVFVIQSVNSTSIGEAGWAIGYKNIGKSVGVEFDTWHNEQEYFFLDDPSSNHVGILTNGELKHGEGSPYTKTVTPSFTDGTIWYVWIDYNGTNLDIRVSQNSVRPTSPLLSRTINISEIIGQESAYVGFTSGTGNGWGNHDIISWEYRDTFDPINNGCICENLYTKEQLDKAVADAVSSKDAVIAQKDQTISGLNATISSMFTKEQLDKAVADAKVSMFTKEQLDKAVADAKASMFTKEQLDKAVADAKASMFTKEQLDKAVTDERQKWDVNGDNKKGLEEAVNALQTAVGIRTP